MKQPFNRDTLIERATDDHQPWDVIIIGGGATGAGIAVDAASRGYRTLLLEQHDFGKGTSSRSTKLIHGGVRYLRQGNLSLVRSALRERGILCSNAPHLVRPLPFLIPAYRWWERTFYRCGLRAYDLLAGRQNLQTSRRVNAPQALAAIPTLRSAGLCGGVVYYDGLFDDARLLINLVQTAIEHGAVCLNYVRVDALEKASGRVAGVIAEDRESGREIRARGRVVINATGPFVDALRRDDDPHAPVAVTPSQGIHLVVDASFLQGETALIVPKTRDGRVMFAIPWHGRTLIGTTDTPIDEPVLEPLPFGHEIQFLLETAGEYLSTSPQQTDVLSVFSGIRPLVQSDGQPSSRLSRDHTILTSKSGLISITGGKWTTYREMAQDCVNVAAQAADLDPKPCRTADLRLHGAGRQGNANDTRWYYGSDAAGLDALSRFDESARCKLHDRLPYSAGEVIWSARHELARTVEDVLSRRTRALLLDAQAAIEVAPHVAALLGQELCRDDAWQMRQCDEFRNLAAGYVLQGSSEDYP